MLFEARDIGSAGLEVRVELQVAAHHDADLSRSPMKFEVEIPTWGDSHPMWRIDSPLRFRTRVWTGVITMNADPNRPGIEPGRPDAAHVKAVFEESLQPIEANMNGEVEESQG